MRAKPLPSAELLRQRFDYDPESGVLTHRLCVDRMGRTNKQFAGHPVGYLNSNGYLMTDVQGKKCRVHRIIWKMVTGEDPEFDVDHENHDRTDNRWDNLRSVTRMENRQNASLSKANTSGACGLSWNKNVEKWDVHITVGRKTMRLGLTRDFDEAVAKRKAAERKYGFHENHGKA